MAKKSRVAPAKYTIFSSSESNTMPSPSSATLSAEKEKGNGKGKNEEYSNQSDWSQASCESDWDHDDDFSSKNFQHTDFQTALIGVYRGIYNHDIEKTVKYLDTCSTFFESPPRPAQLKICQQIISWANTCQLPQMQAILSLNIFFEDYYPENTTVFSRDIASQAMSSSYFYNSEKYRSEHQSEKLVDNDTQENSHSFKFSFISNLPPIKQSFILLNTLGDEKNRIFSEKKKKIITEKAELCGISKNNRNNFIPTLLLHIKKNDLHERYFPAFSIVIEKLLEYGNFDGFIDLMDTFNFFSSHRLILALIKGINLENIAITLINQKNFSETTRIILSNLGLNINTISDEILSSNSTPASTFEVNTPETHLDITQSKQSILMRNYRDETKKSLRSLDECYQTKWGVNLFFSSLEFDTFKTKQLLEQRNMSQNKWCSVLSNNYLNSLSESIKDKKCYILELPIELLAEIVSLLSVDDFKSLQLTCTAFNQEPITKYAPATTMINYNKTLMVHLNHTINAAKTLLDLYKNPLFRGHSFIDSRKAPFYFMLFFSLCAYSLLNFFCQFSVKYDIHDTNSPTNDNLNRTVPYYRFAVNQTTYPICKISPPYRGNNPGKHNVLLILKALLAGMLISTMLLFYISHIGHKFGCLKFSDLAGSHSDKIQKQIEVLLKENSNTSKLTTLLAQNNLNFNESQLRDDIEKISNISQTSDSEKIPLLENYIKLLGMMKNCIDQQKQMPSQVIMKHIITGEFAKSETNDSSQDEEERTPVTEQPPTLQV